MEKVTETLNTILENILKRIPMISLKILHLKFVQGMVLISFILIRLTKTMNHLWKI